MNIDRKVENLGFTKRDVKQAIDQLNTALRSIDALNRIGPHESLREAVRAAQLADLWLWDVHARVPESYT